MSIVFDSRAHWTVQHVAQLTGLTEQQVSEQIAAGQIVSTQISYRSVRVPSAEVARLLGRPPLISTRPRDAG